MSGISFLLVSLSVFMDCCWLCVGEYSKVVAVVVVVVTGL